jgi:hypothetical protein
VGASIFFTAAMIRAFGFLVINVCNHGEHYEMPRIMSLALLATTFNMDTSSLRDGNNV